jgi:hypothetical protein
MSQPRGGPLGDDGYRNRGATPPSLSPPQRGQPVAGLSVEVHCSDVSDLRLFGSSLFSVLLSPFCTAPHFMVHSRTSACHQLVSRLVQRRINCPDNSVSITEGRDAVNVAKFSVALAF